ncbi:unnamed protein product, partial [Nesidiocoris tenuis]
MASVTPAWNPGGMWNAGRVSMTEAHSTCCHTREADGPACQPRLSSYNLNCSLSEVFSFVSEEGNLVGLCCHLRERRVDNRGASMTVIQDASSTEI